MNVFAETKTNEEKEIYEDILGKEILSQKRERKEDFGNVVMDLYLQLQCTYSFSSVFIERFFFIVQLINCTCSEQSAGAQTHKNCLMKSNLKARINDGKDAQAHINDK